MLETLSAISDLSLRVAALDVRLRADVRSAALELDAMARRAAGGDERARSVLLAFASLRASKDDPKLIDALATIAPDSPLFRTTSAARGVAERARLEPMLPAYYAHRVLTAGPPDMSRATKRIWLAPVRERVLRDPRASVIARFLEGPVELRDVLRIAARRPSSPDVARAVASSRYLRELPVREALVRNPFTATWLSLVLLPTIRRKVVDLAVAHEEVRAYARSLG